MRAPLWKMAPPATILSALMLGALAASVPQAQAVETLTVTKGCGDVNSTQGGFVPSLPGCASVASDAGANYAAVMNAPGGELKVKSTFPNVFAVSAVDYLFTVGGAPIALTFSAHVDGTYSYDHVPNTGKDAQLQAQLGLGALASETLEQSVAVQSDSTGAYSSIADHAGCSPAPCILSHDYTHMDATMGMVTPMLLPGSPMSPTVYDFSASLLVQGTAGASEDFFDTETLSLVLPPGVVLINDTGAPLTWITSAATTPVPAPGPLVVLLPSLAMLGAARRLTR